MKLRLTSCIKRDLSLPQEAREVESHFIRPWDGVITDKDSLLSFRKALWFDVLEHLIRCDECRNKLKLRHGRIIEEILRINWLWQNG